VTSAQPQTRERPSDRIAKYVAIVGGVLAICAALGIPTQLGVFGDFRLPGLPGRAVTAISLSQGQGASGTKVTVTGTGFSAGEIVDVRFHTEKVGEASVGDDGAFTANITIPGSFDAFAGGQSFDISATGRQSIRQASQPFKLLAGGTQPGSGPASISLSRGTGPSGTEITVSGRNFTPGEEVTVRFATTEMGRAIADSAGGFALNVRIPGNQDPFAPKQVSIVATGQQSAKFADAPFDLTK
jgi:IPT/TIG domain-containing protein